MMVLTFLILAITIFLFIWGRIRSDIVALLSLLTLFLTGILNVEQALAGFGNSTVIMIAALFVVGEGLSRTGVTAWAGEQMLNVAGSNKTRFLVVLMLGTALLSAFISNTGTVATLMPAVVSAAWSVGSVPARFLMPLAFAANTGGLLALTGTPPNIIVADILAGAGFTPFGYFEYALIGFPLLLASVAYMTLAGQKLLPERPSGEPPIDLGTAVDELTESYALQEDLFQLRVRRGSGLVGQTLSQAGLGRDYGLSVLRIEPVVDADVNQYGPPRQVRNGLERLRLDDSSLLPGPETTIQANDRLWVKGGRESIERAMVHFNLGLQPADDADAQLTGSLLSHEVGLAEVLITARSDYIGQTVARGQFAAKFNIQVLSIRRREGVVDRQTAKLAAGDSLLVRGTWEAIGRLENERRYFVVVGSPEAMARQVVEPSPQAILAVVTLVGMIVLMVTGLVPTVIAALMAAVVMVLGRCLTMEAAYRAISWSSVVLIAAMIPMSMALQVTGGAEFLANGLVNTLGALHPLALMAGVFLLTTSFSQVIHNTATTVLIAPIVLQAALDLGVSPYPMLMIVAVSASTAFLTPIGTTTNLMVMTPGGYRFGDYVRVGLPLALLFLMVSLVLIPVIWPLT